MRRFAFPKNSRLLANSHFRAVMARGISASDGLLVVYACENNREYARLGVSVGKTYGNAVVRNRLKRLIRETFRQNRHLIAAGFDYVVMMSYKWGKKARPAQGGQAGIKDVTFEQVRDSFVALAKRVGVQRA